MTGLSTLAIPADKQWDAADRPEGWRGKVYGLVAHTTGGALPAKADLHGVYHTVEAVTYYHKDHGCHYVNGWRGIEGDDLLQVANENEQARGVGVTNAKKPEIDQQRSIDTGRFEADLPPVLVRLWRARWPGREHSLELLPGTTSANSCYVHVESVPCVYRRDGKLVTEAEPMRPGLRFTRAQHDSVALLAFDVATRNGWPLDEQWWRTPRLLGHEDLTPISRHDKDGGWDPGYLREDPFFDWDYVYGLIERKQAGPIASLFAKLGDLQGRFTDLLATGQEFVAISSAHRQGVTDEKELTNLIFFARHPEMNGRKIEAHESAFGREWLQIRDDIVRPALDKLNQPTGGAR